MRVAAQLDPEAALNAGITYDGEEDVEMWTLDDYLDALRGPPLPNLRLVKVDVEGMELEVIQGARRTITALLPIIWAENTAYFDRQDMAFVAIMHEMGYACGKVESAPQDLICSDAQGRGHQP